jgi:NAD dependent epimerase/dehydratase family enzyme
MAQVVTTGVNAVPAVLKSTGYRFRQPELEPALRQLLQ